MRRFLFINGLVALVGAASVGLVTGGVAHAVVYCDSGHWITSTTVNDSVTAGPGCRITDSTVTGSVTTSSGGTLYAIRDTIGGSVYDRTVSEGLNHICGTAVTGSVYVQNNNNSSVDVSAGYCRQANTIHGSVYVEYNSAVITVDGNTIKKSAYIHQNTADVDLENNIVDASVYATNNTGGGNVTGNAIGNSLLASGNNPPYTISGNTVGGVCNNQGTHVC